MPAWRLQGGRRGVRKDSLSSFLACMAVNSLFLSFKVYAQIKAISHLFRKERKDKREVVKQTGNNIIESVSVGSNSYFISLSYYKAEREDRWARPPDQDRLCLTVYNPIGQPGRRRGMLDREDKIVSQASCYGSKSQSLVDQMVKKNTK